jgi:hypothetical protein
MYTGLRCKVVFRAFSTSVQTCPFDSAHHPSFEQQIYAFETRFVFCLVVSWATQIWSLWRLWQPFPPYPVQYFIRTNGYAIFALLFFRDKHRGPG